MMSIGLGLEDKRALVTGAGAGMGRATAIWLARAGCDVLLADKNAGGLGAAVAEVRSTGRRGEQIVVDLRDAGAAEVLLATAVDAFGGLDIAINNVGMLADRPASSFVDGDDESFRDIVEQNLFLTANCCRDASAAHDRSR